MFRIEQVTAVEQQSVFVDDTEYIDDSDSAEVDTILMELRLALI